MDYYKILGIEGDDKKLQGGEFDKLLKKQYRSLSKKYHPDKWMDKNEKERKEAEDKFKEIQEAYETLSDKNKRQRYDTFGTNGNNFSASWSSNMSAEDIMNEFMRNEFNGFGNYRSKSYNINKGEDKKISITISIEDVFYGRSKEVTYEVDRPCKHCNGMGSSDGVEARCPYCSGTGTKTEVNIFNGVFIKQSTTCPHCHGTGRYIKNPCSHCGGTGLSKTKVTRSFKIPMIDQLFSTFKVTGEGNSSRNNAGVNGDLYFKFNIKTNHGSKFKIDKQNIANIRTNVDILFIDCLVGCNTIVHTIDGKNMPLVIPTGSRDGQEFIIKGEGLPQFNGERGDLIVELHWVTPNLNETQLDKIKEIITEKQ